MAWANAPAAAPMIEPDADYASTVEQEDDYQSRRKYWYQLRPEPQTPSSSSSSRRPTSADGSTGTPSSPSSQGTQHDSRLAPSSPDVTGRPENTVAMPPPASEPPPDRQRCEVWPISYRSADGWLKTCWCIQIDGEPSYQYRPPDFHALSTRYHLVYPPPLPITTPATMTSG